MGARRISRQLNDIGNTARLGVSSQARELNKAFLEQAVRIRSGAAPAKKKQARLFSTGLAN
jgi:hypothetical protein